MQSCSRRVGTLFRVVMSLKYRTSVHFTSSILIVPSIKEISNITLAVKNAVKQWPFLPCSSFLLDELPNPWPQTDMGQ